MSQNIILVITCPYCGTKTNLIVNKNAYQRFINGELAQNAFPDMDPVKRELLISGLCETCQNKLFKTEF